MSTLYELDNECMELMEMLEEDPGSEIVMDTLEALHGELDAKYEGYCKVIREMESRSKAIKEEIDRLDERKSVADNAVKKLRNALFQSMVLTGRKKIDGTIFKLLVKNNPVQLDQIPDSLPDDYMIPQEPKIDKKKLLADVKAGIDVPGVTLKQGQCLMIK